MKLGTNKQNPYIYTYSVSHTLLLYEYIHSNCTGFYSVAVNLRIKVCKLHCIRLCLKIVCDWIKYKITLYKYDKKVIK
jgi:hypothetical protein